jgi:hypothetical protein
MSEAKTPEHTVRTDAGRIVRADRLQDTGTAFDQGYAMGYQAALSDAGVAIWALDKGIPDPGEDKG